MKIKILAVLIVGALAALFIYNQNNESKDLFENIVVEKEVIDRDGFKKIIAFGDSITAGYGLEIEESYPSLLQAKLDEQEYKYEVVNAGLSGDTTAGGLRRIEWSLRDGADIVIVTLGGNDALRGLDPNETKNNLDKILEIIDSSGARIVIGGMVAPGNLGAEYTNIFDSLYGDLAKKYSANLIPFFLAGVALDPALNLPDGIHPTKEGYGLILEKNVLPALEELLEK